MEISDTAKAILEGGNWDKFDNGYGLTDKVLRRAEMMDRANMFAKTFGTEIGKRALAELVELYLTKPIANPNDDMISIGIREGQARMIKWLMSQIELSNKG